MTVGSSVSFTTEADNGKYVCFYGQDDAGNVGVGGSSAIAGIDRTAPVISFTDDVAAGPVQSETVAASSDGSETVVFAYSTDGSCDSTGETYTLSTPLTITAETNNGSYVCARATDAAGNTTYAKSTNDINVDATAPTFTPALATASNSGSTADTITNATTPTINTGTITETGTISARGILGNRCDHHRLFGNTEHLHRHLTPDHNTQSGCEYCPYRCHRWCR